MLRILLVAVLAASVPAPRAQEATEAEARAVVGAWLRAQQAAGVEAVGMEEAAERAMAGPRGTIRVETRARLRYAPGERVAREVVRLTVDGEPVAPERLAALDARHARALGRDRHPLARVPTLAAEVLADAAPRRLAREALGGTPTWRVDLDLPRPSRRASRRASAWFAGAPERPRLVRLDLPAGPGGALSVRYARVDGLDVPVAAEGSARLRQQRRLRDYAVTATFRATYDRHRVARR